MHDLPMRSSQFTSHVPCAPPVQPLLQHRARATCVATRHECGALSHVGEGRAAEELGPPLEQVADQATQRDVGHELCVLEHLTRQRRRARQPAHALPLEPPLDRHPLICLPVGGHDGVLHVVLRDRAEEGVRDVVGAALPWARRRAFVVLLLVTIIDSRCCCCRGDRRCRRVPAHHSAHVHRAAAVRVRRRWRPNALGRLLCGQRHDLRCRSLGRWRLRLHPNCGEGCRHRCVYVRLLWHSPLRRRSRRPRGRRLSWRRRSLGPSPILL
mmetsp:Transcript_27475/g.74003  ORF Transcript_27475/g.74003 Transcript_27475/m.74003 type:complete len:269 (-) Transcript_27475:1222-2028(-)